jgi:uncharacterized metal-binding protein YceD (DUF177 family)
MIIDSEFCRLVPLSKLTHGAEKTFEIEATAQECEALAKRFNILAVQSLKAIIKLSLRAKGKLIKLRGAFQAEVIQSCVITLDPVYSKLEDNFSLSYSETVDNSAPEIDISIEGEDYIEPLLSDSLDIGEAVSEHLALALDPFPRKKGAVFVYSDKTDQFDNEVKPNPFSVLKSLKK